MAGHDAVVRSNLAPRIQPPSCWLRIPALPLRFQPASARQRRRFPGCPGLHEPIGRSALPLRSSAIRWSCVPQAGIPAGAPTFSMRGWHLAAPSRPHGHRRSGSRDRLCRPATPMRRVESSGQCLREMTSCFPYHDHMSAIARSGIPQFAKPENNYFHARLHKSRRRICHHQT